MIVIGVVGLPGSGKGEFSNIAKKMGIPVIVMGDVVRKALDDAGLKRTDRNMGEMSRHLRAGLGMDALAKLTIPDIEDKKSDLVVVDGIRGDSEVELYRDYFDNFCLVSIESSFESRLKRMGTRGRSDDTADEESLRKRDERETGWGLGRAFRMADFRIENEGSLDDFSEKVALTIEEIRERI